MSSGYIVHRWSKARARFRISVSCLLKQALYSFITLNRNGEGEYTFLKDLGSFDAYFLRHAVIQKVRLKRTLCFVVRISESWIKNTLDELEINFRAAYTDANFAVIVM